MASNSQSRSGGDGNPQQSWQQRQSRVSEIAASHHRQNDESWVELASQPSSSSLSSIGDEIVTTGLRVTNSYPPRRRRLQQTQNHMPSTYMVSHAAAQAGTSSQEEYDETESEEDHIMTSSNEQLSPSAALPRQQTAIGPVADSDTDDGSDDDENSTALGVGRPSTSPTFRPQPNAFSHPPSHLHRHSTSSAVRQQPSSSRPSMAQRAHTRPNRGAPSLSYQADNDAALRASLTTLLSCARALPKKEPALAPHAGTSTQPLNLRFAPESELMGEREPSTEAPPPPPAPQAIPPRLRHPAPRTASNSSAPSAAPSSSASSRSREQPEKTKRERAATPAPRAKSPRAAKKKRTASPVPGADQTAATTSISPSVLTWVVSAGVLVLVSVVGFGAGYVIGREVGRQEGAAAGFGGMGFGVGGGGGEAAGNATTSCGREVIRSSSGGTLRRFKWGVGTSVVA
ncbi:hypothetical protein NKR19_g1263 [Coniochaeta hoffmannii]|uniref:Uncharacterized protein n=1 Tax=Coniochaeta hoffmannii TaxID=91930 RepID=A0AA38SCZ6_9PEZI|nr:hypothetical protein NKR19_g1263 [Coniochaeta hoffmannii]